MARPARRGKRAEIIAAAYLAYHGGRIDLATLARVIAQHRAPSATRVDT